MVVSHFKTLKKSLQSICNESAPLPARAPVLVRADLRWIVRGGDIDGFWLGEYVTQEPCKKSPLPLQTHKSVDSLNEDTASRMTFKDQLTRENVLATTCYPYKGKLYNVHGMGFDSTK